MHEKIAALIAYALVGLFLALTPLFAHISSKLPYKRQTEVEKSKIKNIIFSVIGILLGVLLLKQIGMLKISLYFYISMLICFIFTIMRYRSFSTALEVGGATLLGCAAAATLLWWRKTEDIVSINGGIEAIKFLCLWIAAIIIINLKKPKIIKKNLSYQIVLFSVFSVVVIYFIYSTAVLDNFQNLVTLWHHWGAYIGPSEMVLAGARLFYDIPAQYGAGPTILIAWSCRPDCWLGAYWVFTLSTLAYSLLIGAMVWSYKTGQLIRDILLLILCVSVCIFWISYPPYVGTPISTPSVSGARFLPAVLLTSWIVLFPFNKWKTVIGHSIWILGLLWSPEAAFYATFIWCPIYLFDQIKKDVAKVMITSFLKAIAQLAMIACTVFIFTVYIYWINYGVLPDYKYYAAYIISPPGPMPIDSGGAIWFYIITIALSSYSLWSSWFVNKNKIQFRKSLALQLLAYATFSYFLGRSHNNNILNLMPYALLVLLDVFASPSRIFIRQVSAVCLGALVAMPLLFGWTSWINAYQNNQLLTFNFKSYREMIEYSNPITKLGLINLAGNDKINHIEQVINLINIVTSRGEPFTVIDWTYNLGSNYKMNAWSAIHGPANYSFISSDMRQASLKRTADRLKKDGWVIISHDLPIDWLMDFDAVYERKEEINFNDYSAVKYKRKLVQ